MDTLHILVAYFAQVHAVLTRRDSQGCQRAQITPDAWSYLVELGEGINLHYVSLNLVCLDHKPPITY